MTTRISPSSPNATVSSQIVTVPHRSFAATLGGRGSPPDDDPLPIPCIKGDALCIIIGQEEYSKGLADCQNALRGSLTLVKGDKPYMMRDLATKLGSVWKVTQKMENGVAWKGIL